MTARTRVALLLSCLSVAACRGEDAPCAPGAACAPANPCHVGIVECAGDSSSCRDTGADADDGARCGEADVCSAGACVPASTTRTISGTFRNLHRPDDGTETAVGSPPGGSALTAVLVPEAGGAGWTRFPAAAADGTFSVPDVPVGRYFLELERPVFVPQATASGATELVGVRALRLVPLVSGSADLTTVVAARPDLARVSLPTPVSASVSGLDPWYSGSQLLVASSQADVFKRPLLSVPRPSDGVTSHAFTFDWRDQIGEPRVAGLPDPAKGDVVYWYQRANEWVSSGAEVATVSRATRHARLDGFAVRDGIASSVAVGLVASPQTGSLAAAAKVSAFVALAADVSPAAEPDRMALGVLAVPRSASHPDLPPRTWTSLFLNTYFGRADVDFGTFTYGRFLDGGWHEVRVSSYAFALPYDVGVEGYVESLEPVSSLGAGPVSPKLGPPRAPRIDGEDAFASRSGVGAEPTLSWSAPALGTPTSYVVTVTGIAGLQTGDLGELSATVYGATSFRVPPGFLRAGREYYARITARSAPWDRPSAPPFREGVPLHTADCITGVFSP